MDQRLIMKLSSIVCLTLGLSSCENKQSSSSGSDQSDQRLVHKIELSKEYETVIVTIPGRDDLSLRVFQRDGELVAAVIDIREERKSILNQAQRWELSAKSDKEVQMYTRKEPYLLEATGALKSRYDGTKVYFDADGDGIPDYKSTSKGCYRVTKIELEYFKPVQYGDYISDFEPVEVEEIFTEKQPAK